MGCQAQVDIEDSLTFSITTHDPDTGVLTDADADPIYRVYEEETAVPILTGTMSKLDDPNTVGFYSELIVCSAANGFEEGRSYNIYIEATVDSDTGGISYAFKATEVLSKNPDAVSYTYTVTNSVTLLAEAAVQVWVTTDEAGTNVIINGLITDALGVARDSNGNLPLIEPGSYFFWKFKTGFIDDDNPDLEVVA